MSIHYLYIKKVLKLHKANFYAKVEKFVFYSKLVEYLRYIIFLTKLSILDNKVKIIQDWSKLNKVKNIQFFLGFTNFYCWFINNVIILTHLIQKDISWKTSTIYYNLRLRVKLKEEPYIGLIQENLMEFLV